MKTLTLSLLGLSLVASSYASTIFITNNDETKTLATNEADAAALEGAGATDTTVLQLSADDGQGNITITTIGAFVGSNPDTLGMDVDSMGVNNDKWGNVDQRWLFSFDQAVIFDALSFKSIGNNDMRLVSDTWIGEASTTGSGWSFDGSTGTFQMFNSAGSTFTYDFTSAGVSSIPADTQISIIHGENGSGGIEMTSFQISPVPEPSAFALLAGCFGLAWVMARRR